MHSRPAVVAFFLVSSLSPESPPAAQPTGMTAAAADAVYVDKHRSFQFTPPRQWTKKEFDDPRTKVEFAVPGPIPGSKAASLFFLTRPLSGELDLKAEAEDRVARLKQMGSPDARLTTVDFSGVQAQQVEGQLGRQNISLKAILFVKHGRGYTISFTAPREAFAQYWPIAERSLKSLKCLPPEGGPSKNEPSDADAAKVEAEKIRVWINGLKYPDLSVDAEKSLFNAGAAAVPALEDARRSGTPLQRERATKLLEQIRPSPNRPGSAEFRTWNDASGQHKTEAVFLGLDIGKVRLKKRDGSTIEVPLEKLSPADQGFAKDMAESQQPDKSTNRGAYEMAAKPEPRELSADEAKDYVPDASLAGRVVSGDISGSTNAELDGLDSLLKNVQVGSRAERLRFTSEFIRLFGDRAEKVGFTVYGADGRPKYIWPIRDRQANLKLREDQHLIPADARAYLPKVSEATGLTRVWASTDLAGFALPDTAREAVGKLAPSAEYSLTLAERAGPGTAATAWHVYQVRRFGSLLLAWPKHTVNPADPPALIGLDRSGARVAARDAMHQAVQEGKADDALRIGKELVAAFPNDPELWFRLLDAASKRGDLSLVEQARKGLATSIAQARQNLVGSPQSLEFLAAAAYSTGLIALIENCRTTVPGVK